MVKVKQGIRHIRYLGEALFTGLWMLIALILPLPVASWLGGRLARSVGPLTSAHRTAIRNLFLVFPEKSNQEIHALGREMWDNIGRTAFEFPHFAFMSAKKFKRYTYIQGLEQMEPIKENITPYILISAHLANWEIQAKACNLWGIPLALVYRKANNPYVEKIITFLRNRFQRYGISKTDGGAKSIIQALKQKHLLGMLVDQKINTGIPVPFFGRNAMTTPAVANLALKFNAVVLPVRVIRKTGPYFIIDVHPPLPIARTGNLQQDIMDTTIEMNGIIENWIREYPGQWFWVHKRWPKE